MQEGWQRRYEHLELSDETLHAMLSPILPNAVIRSAEWLTGGLVNTNYRITFAGMNDTMVVRIFTRDASACLREVALWQLAHERVPVPEILYADSTGEVMGRPYLVARWIEGVKLDELLRCGAPGEIAAAGEAVGATLHLLADFTFPHAGFFASDLSIAEPLPPPAEACIDFVRESLTDGGRPGMRLGSELTQRLLAVVAEHGSLLREVDPTPRLVHSDYKAQNLLVRQHAGLWQTAAVLDWEFAAATSPLFDLGNLLRYSDRLPLSFERGVTAGYVRQGGVLPPAWKRVIRLMDLVNLLTFLDAPDARGPMVSEVVSLVRATVEQWGEM